MQGNLAVVNRRGLGFLSTYIQDTSDCLSTYWKFVRVVGSQDRLMTSCPDDRLMDMVPRSQRTNSRFHDMNPGALNLVSFDLNRADMRCVGEGR